MRTNRPQPAFTLIELLVSIAIIAILISIAIPALAQVNRSSKFARALSGQRQVMQMLTMYTQGNRDTHPYLLAGQLDGIEPRIDTPLGPNMGLMPSHQSSLWCNLLIDQYPGMLDLIYPDLGFWPEVRERDQQRGVWRGASAATCTLFAAPAYFSDTQPLQDAQLRATRTSEIRFPAAKMILYDRSSELINPARTQQYENWDQSKEVYAFADGSVAVIEYTQFNSGAYVSRTFCISSSGFSTVDGLAGRDR